MSSFFYTFANRCGYAGLSLVLSSLVIKYWIPDQVRNDREHKDWILDQVRNDREHKDWIPDQVRNDMLTKRIMLSIRMVRVGKKHSPAFRIVVQEKTRAPRSKYLEKLGHYIPHQQPKVIEIDAQRVNYWISQGAQPTDSVHNLLVRQEIIKADKRGVTSITKKRSGKLEDKKVADKAKAEEKKAKAAEAKAAAEAEAAAAKEAEEVAKNAEAEAVSEEEKVVEVEVSEETAVAEDSTEEPAPVAEEVKTE